MPNLLQCADAANVIAVIQDILGPEEGDEMLSDLAQRLANILALNADAVRHVGGFAPNQTATADELLERVRVGIESPKIGRAAAFLAHARQELYADETVDFATPEALDNLLGAASLLLRIYELEEDDPVDRDKQSAAIEAVSLTRNAFTFLEPTATIH